MQTIRIKRGDTWKVVFKFVDEDTDEPFNIDGYTGRLQVRFPESEALPLIEVTTESGELVVDGPAGIVTLSVHYSVMEEIDPGNYVTDLELTSPTDERLSTETLQVIVNKDETR